MSNGKKIFFIVKIIQLLIYGISVAWAFFYRGNTPNWPLYLLLVGILVGNFVPLHYRTNFFSTDSGLFLKKKTRKLENIIEMTITCIVIFLVIFLNVF
ncbi:hypothetical protein EFL02_11240 [Enterococcus faecium]|uniref:hypothetical protein n=1 Tax=Enterococcus sp. HMSC061C05 TaxID=1739492 RepID=UPI0008A28453|nr:hypothetical protein [Enterococcus sp. HMSC061C05]EGP4767175.1 hypothetical protein [Enterococcus faecium]EGP4864475.1 hypothetical protein [Enterococcus faecium]EGP5145013.1 hypothetical protein [Enterococcus faecium]EGP5249629.1 hypothetical protein [Enterococcus faecium]EGP5393417.1 hypothetical protein [Enterococcus faecium]